MSTNVFSRCTTIEGLKSSYTRRLRDAYNAGQDSKMQKLESDYFRMLEILESRL